MGKPDINITQTQQIVMGFISPIIDEIVDRVSERVLAASKKEPKFYTRKEAAEILHVTLPTLARITKDGLLISKRVGSRILYEADAISSGHDDSSEVELTKILVHELYRNREEVLLLINGAGGSSMENALDLIIDEMDEHNLMLTKAMCDELQIPMIHHALVHWMSHNQVDMFLYMIQHIEEEEQALAFAGQAMNYLLGGWYGMFGVRG